MKRTAAVLGAWMALVLFSDGYVLAQAPMPISPGSMEGMAVVISGSPLFSWSGVEDALGYRVAVFEEDESGLPFSHGEMALLRSPVIEQEIPEGGLSWTPSADRGLCGGTYVWYAGAVKANNVVEWSEGRIFKVDALAGLNAGADNCLSSISGVVPDQKASHEPALPGSPGWHETGAMSLEQIVWSGQIREWLSNPGPGSGDHGKGVIKDQVAPTGTEGTSNTFYGIGAGENMDGDGSATFIGANAGHSNTTGATNTFIGWRAGSSNITGDWNTFVGERAGRSNTTGKANTFIGRCAGNYSTEGYDNTFVGRSAGYENTTGNFNTFMGRSAGYSSSTGNENTFIGQNAGMKNTTGNANTFMGRDAGHSNTTGSNNVFIGYRAGYNNETGSNRLYIANSDTDTPLIYGEFDNNIVRIHGRLLMVSSAVSSDRKLKRDIRPLESALDRVMALKGVSYNWDTERYGDWGFTDRRQIGLVAQEVEAVIPELVTTDQKGYKAVSYAKLTAVLVEAVKELKAENERLRRRLMEKTAEQQSQIDELRSRQQSQMDEQCALIKGVHPDFAHFHVRKPGNYK